VSSPESGGATSPRTRRLFGTDGIRGKAGQFPLDHETVRRLGGALVRALPAGGTRARLLVGRDTRESGGWIEAELAYGASGESALVTSVGVVPTPAVAYLTRAAGYDAGIVISASHNPFEDNGIKVFSGSGEKFTERLESQVEEIVADRSWQARSGAPVQAGSEDLVHRYLDHLRAILPDATLLAGTKVAIDCANGATTSVAPMLFRSLGLDVLVIGAEPDGRNINLHCGSTHPEALAAAVVSSGASLGVAFDGDGDRAIFIDHLGRIVDGDAVMFLSGRQLKEENRLKGDVVVATVMSNIGLELALGKLGVGLVRTAVGDKYVMEEMQSRGASLGGEQSGHVIFADYLFTGDGLCTAMNVLRTMGLRRRSLAELTADLVIYPQVLLNVRVRQRVDLQTIPAVASAIARVQSHVASHGRLLVRYSGTEPLLRIMLEGRDEHEIRALGQEIVDAVKAQLG
jgi:phosphoglucosamine mutase